MIPKDVELKPCCVLVFIMCLTSYWIGGECINVLCYYNSTTSGNIKMQHANTAVSWTNCLKWCLVVRKRHCSNTSATDLLYAYFHCCTLLICCLHQTFQKVAGVWLWAVCASLPLKPQQCSAGAMASETTKTDATRIYWERANCNFTETEPSFKSYNNNNNR